MSKQIFLPVIAFYLSLLTGCSSISNEVRNLESTMLLYERSLRWQEYNLALAVHKDAKKNFSERELDRLKQFRITGYDVIYSNINGEQRKAEQVVELKYYRADYAIVKKKTLKLNWEYNETNERWYLTNPFPTFK